MMNRPPRLDHTATSPPNLGMAQQWAWSSQQGRCSLDRMGRSTSALSSPLHCRTAQQRMGHCTWMNSGLARFQTCTWKQASKDRRRDVSPGGIGGTARKHGCVRSRWASCHGSPNTVVPDVTQLLPRPL